jgi:hypothetical protein
MLRMIVSDNGDVTRLTQALIARYAHAVDDRDVEGVVACFTADATLRANGGANEVVGRAAISDYFEDALRARPAMAGGVSTHLLGNVVVVECTDTTATVETSGIVCLATPTSDQVTLRGVRYRDRCTVGPDGWRIARREHWALWQCTAPGGLIGA